MQLQAFTPCHITVCHAAQFKSRELVIIELWYRLPKLMISVSKAVPGLPLPETKFLALKHSCNDFHHITREDSILETRRLESSVKSELTRGPKHGAILMNESSKLIDSADSRHFVFSMDLQVIVRAIESASHSGQKFRCPSRRASNTKTYRRFSGRRYSCFHRKTGIW